MAYNPKSKQFQYSLLNDIDGKNQNEVSRMVPRILRKLAMGHIDLKEEGYKFLDHTFIGVITDVTYKQASKYLYDYKVYDYYITNIDMGVIPVTVEEYNILKSIRNEKSSKYKAYKLANDGLLTACASGQISQVVSTAQQMKAFSNFY